MKNEGRIYAITSGIVVVGAVILLLIIVLLWYLFGYDYVVAP
jgi:hypothetical protein